MPTPQVLTESELRILADAWARLTTDSTDGEAQVNLNDLIEEVVRVARWRGLPDAERARKVEALIYTVVLS